MSGDRIFPRYPCPPNSNWSQEATERLIVLREQGLSGEEIGADLGRKPTAVFHRVYKLKLLGFDVAEPVVSARDRAMRGIATTIAAGQANRAELAKRLPAMLAEHEWSIRRTARAYRIGPNFIARVMAEFGIAAPKQQPGPRPNMARMTVADALRSVFPARPKVVLTDLPDCDDSRINKARAILWKDFDCDPFDVVQRTGLHLRQVYQVRGEVRTARRHSA